MNTKRDRTVRVWSARLTLGALLIALSCTGDTHVGCSPTLTCSLRPARFAPPVTVDAGPSDCGYAVRSCPVAQLTLGGRHACAVTDAKNLICWGDNDQAQRGMSEALDTPLDAGADAGSYRNGFARVLDDVRAVSAGAAHTCALLTSGSVQCWGRSVEGQVDGSLGRELTEQPVYVPVQSVQELDAGGLHTCARTAAGIVCWGSNRYGQCGRDPSDMNPAPHLIADTDGADELACGVRHCCMRRAEQVACWGELIGANAAPYVTAQPVVVPDLGGVLQIAAGAGHSCALRAGGVVCWGLNDDGQLGDGTTQASGTPVVATRVPPGTGFIAAGGGEVDGQLAGHTCAVDGAGQVLCWGRNAEGQLGRVISADHLIPEAVQAYHPDSDDILDQISRVALGALFSCALGSRGSVYCWGDDHFGQLGDNPDTERERRMPVPGEALRVQRFGRSR